MIHTRLGGGQPPAGSDSLSLVPHSFQGKLVELEIARGHDGFLRGPPDPVLLVAAYACVGSEIAVIGRTLHRFRPRPPFPGVSAPDVVALPSAAVGTDSALQYVIVAVALEEDGGRDVQRLYGALEHHRKLAVWATDHHEVDPAPLAGLVGTGWSTPLAVELHFDGQAVSGTCASDKWIGAVAWALRPREPAQSSRYRLPFLAPDRRNDWTAIVDIAH